MDLNFSNKALDTFMECLWFAGFMALTWSHAALVLILTWSQPLLVLVDLNMLWL